MQHALPARNNATDKRHRRASMASQIVLRWLSIVRQRLAHRNQVPHFPCFPSMELMRVRGCIWQNVFKFQAGPLQSTKLGTVVPDDWQSISHHILSQCGQIGLRFLRTSSQRSGGIHLSPRSRQGFSSQGACNLELPFCVLQNASFFRHGRGHQG